MDIYREKLLENYQSPNNYGAIDDAEYTWELENTNCGDRIKIYINTKNDIIQEITFEGEGCAIAIASASILTEEIKGKKIQDVQEMELDDLLKLLGTQLTMSRIKCAELSLETTKVALEKS